MITRARASALLLGGTALAGLPLAARAAPKPVPGLNKIDHIIVIYLKNRSFDHLYGMFPGADGLSRARGAAPQIDEHGRPYEALPAFANRPLEAGKPSLELPALPNAPFDLSRFVAIDKPLNAAFEQANTYYHGRQAVNGGKMNGYVAIAGSPAMGFYDGSRLPMWSFAQDFVLADNFFQGGFGGTAMNHFLLFCGAVPVWPDAPPEFVTQLAPDGALVKEGLVTPDGFLVNNLTPEAVPHAPLQTMPHIGNRLDAAGVSWAWYAGGSTVAQRPFLLLNDLTTGTAGNQQHVKAENDFVADLTGGTLPQVAFMKPFENEHPKKSMGLLDADRRAADLVRAVQDSQYWKSSVIVVTYDEGHSFWDHVAPPKIDRWGPGRRVPALIISPFAKKHYVDHTRYDTTSILKLIETRFGLEPLSARDAGAADLTAALAL